MNPWNVLGLKEGSTPEEIKKAYRKLASKLHPDKGGDTAAFQELQAAYEQLTNPQPRQNSQPGSPFGFGGGPGFDPFEQFFRGFGTGGGFRQNGGGWNEPTKNQDSTVHVAFTLEEFLNGATRDVLVNLPDRQQEIKIVLKAAYKPGATIRFSGLGGRPDPKLAPGDLHVTLMQHPHSRFERHNDDLYIEASIDAILAMVGGTYPLDTLDGKQLSITIPPGSQNSTTLRVKEWGMVKSAEGQRGDLLVRLNISVPVLSETDMSKSIMELYRDRYPN